MKEEGEQGERKGGREGQRNVAAMGERKGRDRILAKTDGCDGVGEGGQVGLHL